MEKVQKLLDKLLLALRARRRTKHRRWLKSNKVLMPPAQDNRDWQGKFKASLRRE